MSDKPRIDQLMAGFAEGDAISHEAVEIRNLCRKWGHASDIFVAAGRVSPSVRGEVRDLSAYAPAAGDIAMHHYGIRSPASDLFQKTGGIRKILIYHNITPPEYFQGFDDVLVRDLREARGNLPAIAGQSDAVWAVSRFDAEDLMASGVRNAQVFPLLFSGKPLDIAPDALVRRRFTAPLKTILFVGRIAPNKRVENLIHAFAWYHGTIDPYSRLVIVGSPRSCPRYYTMLRMLVGDLDLANVCFEGFASPAGLVAYYDLADVFVSASEHEGYCLPLVEAMYKNIPVVSRAGGGTPEAMGGAGVLYQDLESRELAELIHLVLSDAELNREVLVSQRKRIRDVLARPVEDELKSLLSDFLGRTSAA